MYKQENIKPYKGDEDKGKQVEQMFDNIAPTYDSLNHSLSLEIDRLWRKRAIKELAKHNPASILDIATGTGDFAIQAAQTLQPTTLIGVDISEGMMEIGKRKVLQAKLNKIISFAREDCMNLSFADYSFDAVTAAFGIRNFSNLEQGLKEMHRVLKPGCHLCVIELTSPISFPMKQIFKVYSHTILPLCGRLISKDRNAYEYLTASIEAFPQGEKMQEILQNIGFTEVKFERLTFGVCTMYLATK